MQYTMDEVMEWQVKTPDGLDVTYVDSGELVTVKSVVAGEEKRIRVQRLRQSPRKKAFTDAELELLHVDRKNGMSIRQLAAKYGKSTRTIQKYLKIDPFQNDVQDDE